MFANNLDSWNIVYYKDVSLLNKLKSLSVEVYNFKQVSNYKFYFQTQRKNRKIIKENFKNHKLISRQGFFNYLEAMIKKTTFICVLIASLFLFDVSKRIWKIEIVGDYVSVEESIKEELFKCNISIGEYYPNSSSLTSIENQISLYLSKEIEFLEIKRSGSIISVRYQKRRVSEELPIKGTNLYATKDGMIKYFDVQSGVKKVKEYDYVRKGDLLVSDVVETSSGELINVGTLGSVYANTFYVIEVNLESEENDESVIFSKMLDKAKVKISENISKGESIEVERVLNYKIENNKGYMKVYYMLLEDITI